jgi:RNA polymerase sigma-70 factor, ECF subfamily
VAIDARRAAETAARTSYGRLVAILASRSRDIAAAEDALAEAFRIALDVWPKRGVPERPEAWLVTTARRELSHQARARQVHDAARPALDLLGAEREAGGHLALPDARLGLLFVCAHPAIDAAARTPLMLQAVLGLDAQRIAAAFLTSPSAMSQRLVRAKTKIRDAGIRFALPGAGDLGERLEAVLEAIYAAFGSAFDEAPGAEGKGRDLSEEAIFLARLLVELMPDEAEPKGLLALMLACEARRPARRDADGRFVPLDAQDRQMWSEALIAEAETVLAAAARHGRLGRFQIEAAIQSAHNRPAPDGRTKAMAILTLYEALCRLHPTLGATVGRAAAIGEAFGPQAGLDALAPLAAAASAYQPFWALTAHLAQQAGQQHEAQAAYRRAIELAEDPAAKAYLLMRRDG